MSFERLQAPSSHQHLAGPYQSVTPIASLTVVEQVNEALIFELSIVKKRYFYFFANFLIINTPLHVCHKIMQVVPYFVAFQIASRLIIFTPIPFIIRISRRNIGHFISVSVSYSVLMMKVSFAANGLPSPFGVVKRLELPSCSAHLLILLSMNV